MKKFFTLIAIICATVSTSAQSIGWPDNYSGVMLQGFYWDSYTQSSWTNLEKQADNFKGYFDLVWVPQSGKTLSTRSMGYDPYYYFNQNSSFGTVDELKSMIQTFKNDGIGTIADVVVNHRNTNGWFSFPAETWNGDTYQMVSTDIVRDDDGGKTLTEANKENVSLSANYDEGEGWNGMRDLDHKSANVQKVIKAYEKFLVNEIGYTGFRYDMVRGFAGSHIADYNDAAGVQFSVGENWSDNNTIENWINATNKKSAAFDFQFRYNVRDAVNQNDWTKLNSTNNLVHDANYRRYAVTFVENHDMQDRGTTSGYDPDPIKKDTLAANAYLLAMPGTPCVFYSHYLAYPTEIKAMIDVRKAAGITNTSTYTAGTMSQTGMYYANDVKGSNGTLRVLLGNGTNDPSSAQWTKVLSGKNFRYFLSSSMNIPFADKPSGDYDDSFQTTLTAVTNNSSAKLVYTLNGTNPTAASPSVTSGSKVSINKAGDGTSVTLKVGLLINGTVQNVITRTYNFKAAEAPVTVELPACATKITDAKYYAYFEKPASWSSTIYVWAWKDKGANVYSAWPGSTADVSVAGTNPKTGNTVYLWKYNGSNTVDKIIFDEGSGKEQTRDLDFKNGNYYTVNGLYGNVEEATTGITDIKTNTSANPEGTWYSISGIRQNGKPTQKGIYIHNGKKFVVR